MRLGVLTTIMASLLWGSLKETATGGCQLLKELHVEVGHHSRDWGSMHLPSIHRSFFHS